MNHTTIISKCFFNLVNSVFRFFLSHDHIEVNGDASAAVTRDIDGEGVDGGVVRLTLSSTLKLDDLVDPLGSIKTHRSAAIQAPECPYKCNILLN